ELARKIALDLDDLGRLVALADIGSESGRQRQPGLETLQRFQGLDEALLRRLRPGALQPFEEDQGAAIAEDVAEIGTPLSRQIRKALFESLPEAHRGGLTAFRQGIERHDV